MVKKHRRGDTSAVHKKDAAVRRELRKGKRGTGAHHTDKEVVAFNAQLAPESLVVHPIVGDGNCLFRAISHQIYGDEERHFAVRLACVAEMERDPDNYAPFLLDEDEGWEGPSAFADYCKAMRSSGEWGGNLEIVAAGRALSRHVVIHRLGEPRWEIVSPGAVSTIHISYHNGDHYASVRGLVDGERGHAAAIPQLRVAPDAAAVGADKRAHKAAAAAAAAACERVVAVCEMMWPDRVGDMRAQADAAAALADCNDNVEGAVELLLAGWRPEGVGGQAGAAGAGGAPPPRHARDASDASASAVAVPKPSVACAGVAKFHAAGASIASAESDSPEQIRRNGPCPCGSTRAYRRCCLGVHAAAKSRAKAIAGAVADAFSIVDAHTIASAKSAKAGRADESDVDAAAVGLAAVRI